MKYADLKKTIAQSKFVVVPWEFMLYIEDLYKGDLSNAFDTFEKDNYVSKTFEADGHTMTVEYSYQYVGEDWDNAERVWDIEHLDVDGIKLGTRDYKKVTDGEGLTVGYYDGEHIIIEFPEIGDIED